MSIRFKVILPYLILTLVVAITGAYVVTKLVTSSQSERLKNQLLEAGRVVTDGIARQEIDHVKIARLIAYTDGLGEALQKGNVITVRNLAQPVAGGLGIENLIFTDRQGTELVHLMEGEGKTYIDKGGQYSTPYQSIIQAVLNENDPEGLPHRIIALHPVDGRHYYFTSMPIAHGNQMAGVIVIGTSLETLLHLLKDNSMADVIFYSEDGRVIASTLVDQRAGTDSLSTFSISEETYHQILDLDFVRGENLMVGERSYSLARGPIQIGNDQLGAFAVVLSSDFVVETSSTNRFTYTVLYSLAMILVVLIGYIITRLIINRLSSLVNTSHAIAEGDLAKRTGISGSDEIGVLANTFDEMTENLQQRTLELEKTNRILEQMDGTKMHFINISAHELRTPLTLIQGYTQMIQFKAGNNPELNKYATGILEGSRRMVEIIDSMLDLSRIDSNELNLMPAEVEINPLIDKVHKTFESSFVERNLKFHTEGLDQLPPMSGDADLLYKVFYHLVMNAIKYTPNGGEITVRGRAVEDTPGLPEIEVTVQDTGIGIDPQYHDLVFEKFFQTGEVLFHSTGRTKFKGGGPGLGLAIARGIVLAHHGRIWVESPGYDEVNNPGSTFYVRLPLDGAGE